MKRFITLVLMVCLLLSGCAMGEKGRELRQIGRTLGVDLSAGTLERFEDSHGGFHGDGVTSAEVALAGLAEKLEEIPGWRPLPMTENAAKALERCGGAGGAAAEGFYYLYDRHGESEDPYDDSQLDRRYSWNFTIAVYDSRLGRLYYCEMDT